MDTNPNVFLSYPRRHRGWTQVLHRNLEACLGEGSVFLDEVALKSGRSWVAGLQSGLTAAQRIAIVATPESFASPWVRGELEGFQSLYPHWKGAGRIQVVLLADTPLPLFLRSAQHVDFRGHDDGHYGEAFRRLVAGLRGVGDPGSMAALTGELEFPNAPVAELPPELRTELIRVLTPLLAPEVARISLAQKLEIPVGALEDHASCELAANAALVLAHPPARNDTERAARVLEQVLDLKLVADGEVEELRALQERVADLASPAGPTGAESNRVSIPRPARLSHPTGTVPLDSAFYVRRGVDAHAEAEIDGPNSMVHLLAARQMGKSSLLVRLAERARRTPGLLVVPVNFQDLDLESLADLRALLTSLAALMLDAAGRDPELAQELQGSPLSAKVAFKNLLRREVLEHHAEGVLWLTDETDRVVSRTGTCAQDFLSMLRSLHEAGKVDPVMARLRLVLAFSTEADMIAPGVAESPLDNVGLKCPLDDFDRPEVERLIGAHDLPDEEVPIEALLDELGGNPYLVRRSLHAIATGEASWDEILEQARDLSGPLGDQLRHHLRHLEERPDLASAFGSVLTGRPSLNPSSTRSLEGMGLIRRRGRTQEPRYPLYRILAGHLPR